MLARGDITPEAASRWAHPYLTAVPTEPTHFDESTWKALVALGAADTKDTDGGYLYGPENHVQWQRNFDQATGIA